LRRLAGEFDEVRLAKRLGPTLTFGRCKQALRIYLTLEAI
jgi:hypothetical protein